MKIKVTEKAWYNNSLYEEGRIIDFEGDKLPAWATLANSEDFLDEPNKETEKNVSSNNTINANGFLNWKSLLNISSNKNIRKDKDDTNEGQEDSEYLEKLRDLAADNEVWINSEEHQTIKDEIKMLEQELKNKGVRI